MQSAIQIYAIITRNYNRKAEVLNYKIIVTNATFVIAQSYFGHSGHTYMQ